MSSQSSIELGGGHTLAITWRRRWHDQEQIAPAIESIEFAGRPLVVIDPEDREQVDKVWRAILGPLSTAHELDDFADCLRSLVTDPKPDEPTGRYAVVLDANGDEWVLDGLEKDHACSGRWWSSTRAQQASPDSWRADYADIAAVRVLSEGVPA